MLSCFLLYNNVNESYVYIYPSFLSFPTTPPTPPLQVITEHRAELPVSHSSFPLASYFHMAVYICQSYSHNLSHLLLPLLCPQISSLHLHLYSCPGTKFTCTIFLDSTYMRQYPTFVFLYLACFTLYDRLQIHPHLQMTHFHSSSV